MVLYAETSAVLAWLLGEPSKTRVIEAIDSASLVVSSVLTVLETYRALVRGTAQGVFDEAHAAGARRVFTDSLRSWELLEMTREVRARAGARFPIEPVRSLDAIHLATVLRFIELYDDVRIVTFDERILVNLPLLGIPSA